MRLRRLRPILPLLVALFLAPPLAAQGAAIDSSLAADIRTLLRVMRSADVIAQSMKSAIPAQRAANPSVPAAFWDEFERRATAQVGTLVDRLVPVYAAHFNDAEIRALIEFYQSGIGQRLVTEQPKLVQETMAAGQEWGMALGQEVARDLDTSGAKQPVQ